MLGSFNDNRCVGRFLLPGAKPGQGGSTFVKHTTPCANWRNLVVNLTDDQYKGCSS